MTEHYIAYKGKNVSLGAMHRDYIPIFVQHANDLSVTQGTTMRPPFTREDEEAWFERVSKKSTTQELFAVLVNEQDGYRYIGHMGLHAITWPSAFGTSGSLLFESGKGYGTEAKLLLLYHAFYVTGLRKVCSEVKAFNGNSWGHLLKCGYHQVGRRKDHHFHDGGYVDVILLEVFREDFDPIWKRYTKTGKLPALTEKQRKRLGQEMQS